MPMSFQIGKNGITPEVIATLDKAYETHKQIRISVLKSAGRTKETIGQMAEQLNASLANPIVYKIIGFTIIASRRSKARRASSAANQ